MSGGPDPPPWQTSLATNACEPFALRLMHQMVYWIQSTCAQVVARDEIWPIGIEYSSGLGQSGTL